MEYMITEFGATVCDSLQTKAIQKAIDTCFLAGGGRVVIPAGIFRTGGIRLRSNVTLYLQTGAILEGSPDLEDYMDYLTDQVEPVCPEAFSGKSGSVNPFSRWSNGLIKAIDADNIAVIGEPGSWLDGVNCYDSQGEEGYRGPHLLHFYHCSKIHLEGYTIRRSGNWAHNMINCRDISTRRVTVYGGHDGLDIFGCDQVLVEDCTFLTGDDSIAGFNNQDVTIRNCHFESACSVFRFGGTRVRIEKCRAKAPAPFGHRQLLTDEEKRRGAETTAACRHNTGNVFLYYCDHRMEVREVPGDIVISDCEFDGMDALFQMDFNSAKKWCCNKPLNDITFRNCKCLNICAPSLINGSEEAPVSFCLEQMEFSAREGYENVALADIRNFRELIMKQVKLSNLKDPRVIVRTPGRTELGQEIRVVEDESGYRYTVS